MSKKTLPFIVAIDGPAGAGKSTVARLVAQALDCSYIDTGAMYRAVTWLALEENADLGARRELTKLAKNARLTYFWRDGRPHITVNGHDVTGHIRTERITKHTHYIASTQGVRRVLVAFQRRLGKKGRVVMEGRDIGTKVFPQARFKFFLDASPLERARRRHSELKRHHPEITLKDIAEAIKKRDHLDKTRGASPLRAAPDAQHIDTTALTQHKVAMIIIGRIKKALAG